MTAVNLLGIFLDTEKEQGPLINDQTFITLMVVGIMVLFAVLFVAFAVWWNKAQRELKHVNRRLRQCTSERSRQHYIRRRRMLLLSFLPFIDYSKYK